VCGRGRSHQVALSDASREISWWSDGVPTAGISSGLPAVPERSSRQPRLYHDVAAQRSTFFERGSFSGALHHLSDSDHL
jgi:hypothetical protein